MTTFRDIFRKHNLVDRNTQLNALRGFDALATLVIADMSSALDGIGQKIVQQSFTAPTSTVTPWTTPAEVDRLSGGEIVRLAPGALGITAEGDEYTRFQFTPAIASPTLSKHTGSFDVSFELITSDRAIGVVTEATRQLASRALEAEADRAVEALIGGSWAAVSSTADKGAPTAARIGSMLALLASQIGPDGSRLNLRGGSLICPVGLAAIAADAIDSYSRVVGDGQQITLCPEPRLDAASAAVWYVAARTDLLPPVAVCRLAGYTQPEIQTMKSKRGDGLTVSLRHPVGAVVTDTRAAVSNPGA